MRVVPRAHAAVRQNAEIMRRDAKMMPSYERRPRASATTSRGHFAGCHHEVKLPPGHALRRRAAAWPSCSRLSRASGFAVSARRLLAHYRDGQSSPPHTRPLPSRRPAYDYFQIDGLALPRLSLVANTPVARADEPVPFRFT